MENGGMGEGTGGMGAGGARSMPCRVSGKACREGVGYFGSARGLTITVLPPYPRGLLAACLLLHDVPAAECIGAHRAGNTALGRPDPLGLFQAMGFIIGMKGPRGQSMCGSEMIGRQTSATLTPLFAAIAWVSLLSHADRSCTAEHQECGGRGRDAAKNFHCVFRPVDRSAVLSLQCGTRRHRR